MRTIKQFLFTVAALLCSISAIAYDFEVDGICYNITSTEELTVEITYESNNDRNFLYIDGSFVIPENVVYRGRTFRVTSIGKYAFRYCSRLTSVTIPNSVTSIEQGAFEDCDGLTSVTIPNSVTSIGSYAFYDCDGLTSVTIGNSVTSIGPCAFSGCSGLTSVTIGNSVTSIGFQAFWQCYGLTSVTIPNSVTNIGDEAFSRCSGLTSVTIGNSVTSIGDNAFSYCYGLTSVTIGNSVTSIGDEAFRYCDNIGSIYIATVNPPSVGNYNFDSTDYVFIDLYVPKGSLSAYKSHSVWGRFNFIYTYDATGIEGVEMDNEFVNDAPVYNLQGMKMQDTDNLPAGIYIKGGKKYLVK